MENQENHNAKMLTPQARKISYRNLLNKVEEIQERDDLGLQVATDLGGVFREVSILDEECSIDERVNEADETILESLVLASTSSVLRKCIKAVDVFTSTYEPTELTDKIISTVKNEDEDFEPNSLIKLLHNSRRLIPTTPEYRTVYGTYDLDKVPAPKPRKERVRHVKERLQKKAPEKVTNLDKEEESIEEIVKILHDVLLQEYDNNGKQAVKYYDYVIDNGSFTNTVENMFYCSFLIRDGRAHITLDSNAKPIIKPIRKRDLKDFRGNQGVNAQVITAINVEEWKQHKKEGMIQKHKRSLPQS